MRLKTTAGFSAPLLLSSFAAILTGCPTSTAQNDLGTSPIVTAVYAVDQNGDGLPDVALYLAKDQFSTSGIRVSPKSPASFTGFRIEVDQALDGKSIESKFGGVEALASDNAGPLIGFSACVGTSTVQLIDVQGNPAKSVAAGTSIPSSICYNPSTVVGSNPHIDIYAGVDAVAADVFTCQTFSNAGSLLPNHQYAIKLASSINGSNGKGLTTPTGTGWTTGQYAFSTSDFDLLAAGYLDASTGYTHFHSKTAAGIGFLKDLDAEDKATFRMPTGGDPFFIFLSDFVQEAGTDGVLGTPLLATGDGKPAITVVRKTDQSPVTVHYALDSEIGYNYGDPRVIDIFPNLALNILSGTGGTWEPGVTYQVTLNPTLISADSGNQLGGSAVVFEFTAGDAPLAAVKTIPANNQTGANYTASPPIQVIYQTPIDKTTVNSTNIKLTKSDGTDVPLTFGLPAASRNFQRINITPSTTLSPSTTYSLKITGLKGAPAMANGVCDATAGCGPTEYAGKAFADLTRSFTTVSFQMGAAPAHSTGLGTYDGDAALTDQAQAHSLFNSTGNIERVLSQSPWILGSGTLVASFVNTPTGVSNASLHLKEGSGSTATDISGYTVAANPAATGAGKTAEFALTAPSSYAVKCNQQYSVVADQTITDPNSVALKLEGCTGSSCPDPRVFGTRAPAVQILANTDASFVVAFWRPDRLNNASPSRRRIDFGIPVLASSITSQLPTGTVDNTKAIRLYKQGADGSLTPVAISCSVDTGTSADGITVPAGVAMTVSCTPAAKADANQAYVASAVFTTTNPAKPAATMVDFQGGATTVQLDPASCSFAGSVTASFVTACP